MAGVYRWCSVQELRSSVVFIHEVPLQWQILGVRFLLSRSLVCVEARVLGNSYTKNILLALRSECLRNLCFYGQFIFASNCTDDSKLFYHDNVCHTWDWYSRWQKQTCDDVCEVLLCLYDCCRVCCSFSEGTLCHSNKWYQIACTFFQKLLNQGLVIVTLHRLI